MPAKFDMRQWEKLAKLADPVKLKRSLRRHGRLANQRVAQEAIGTIRRYIKDKKYEKNAQLTIEIKGSETPLVDRGYTLFQAISKKEISWSRIFVGILKTDRFYNIGAALHEGTTIKVTPKMRAMFDALWQASVGILDPSALRGRARRLWERKKKWLPLKPGTTAIIIPARRFIDRPLRDPKLRLRARRHWAHAYWQALREQVR